MSQTKNILVANHRHPARNVHVFHIEVTEDHGHSSLYSKLENAIPSEEYVPIFFDVENHLVSPFKNRMEIVRFFQNIKLSFPIQMIRFDSVNVLWRAPEDLHPNEMMTQAARILKVDESSFPVFHTRQMKSEFRELCKKMGAQIPPHFIRKIYSELAGDESADDHPEIDERVRQAIIGDDPDLIVDLRHWWKHGQLQTKDVMG